MSLSRQLPVTGVIPVQVIRYCHTGTGIGIRCGRILGIYYFNYVTLDVGSLSGLPPLPSTPHRQVALLF